MATVANQYDPNNPNASNQGGGGQVLNSTAGGVNTAGGAGAYQGGGAAGGVSNTAKTSTGAPNIQQYIAANQGAGQQLAQGIQGNIQNQANQIDQGINTAQNAYNTTGLNNLNAANQGQVIGQAFQNPQALLDAYNNAQQSATPGATQQPVNQGNLNAYQQFQQLESGGYNPAIQNYGQTQQQNIAQLQSQANQLGQTVAGARNELGQGQLLRSIINQPGYSQGQQTLDQLFLQGQTQPLNQSLQNIASTTAQNVGNFNTNTQAQIQALQNLSGQGQSAIQNLFTQGAGGANPASNPVLAAALGNIATGGNLGLNQIEQNSQNALTQAQTNAANLKGQLFDASGNPNKAFQQGNLTTEQLNALGLGGLAGQQTWGVNVANAGQYQLNNPDITTVSNPNDIARFNALNQLAAGGPGKTVISSPYSTSETAGSYNSPISMNPQALQTAIAAQQATLNKDALAALSGVQASPDDAALVAQMRGEDPAKAYQDYQNFIQGIKNNYQAAKPGFGGVGSPASYTLDQVLGYFNGQFAPFNNFYNQTYAPAAAARLGQSTPDQTPLPTNPDGTINWGGITAPQGK